MIETLDSLLRSRHSCRAFRPDPIPVEIIERIVTTAGRVPSWCNAQPWHVHVTQPEETDRLRAALYDHAQSAAHAPDIAFPSQYTGPYKARRSECGWALYDSLGIQKGDRAASTAQMMENFRFFGAPHMALITTEADLGAYGLLDCGAFVTAFTLAAQALDVATIPQAAIASYSGFIRDWFDLRDNRQTVCAISFGRADPDHPANTFRTTRAEPAEILNIRD